MLACMHANIVGPRAREGVVRITKFLTLSKYIPNNLNIKIFTEYVLYKHYLKFIEKSTQFNRTYRITYDTYIRIYIEKILNQLHSVGLSQVRPNHMHVRMYVCK